MTPFLSKQVVRTLIRSYFDFPTSVKEQKFNVIGENYCWKFLMEKNSVNIQFACA